MATDIFCPEKGVHTFRKVHNVLKNSRFPALANLWVNIGTREFTKIRFQTSSSHALTGQDINTTSTVLTMPHTIAFNHSILLLSKSIKFLIVFLIQFSHAHPSLFIGKWPYLASKHVHETSGVALLRSSHRKRQKLYQVLATEHSKVID